MIDSSEDTWIVDHLAYDGPLLRISAREPRTGDNSRDNRYLDLSHFKLRIENEHGQRSSYLFNSIIRVKIFGHIGYSCIANLS